LIKHLKFIAIKSKRLAKFDNYCQVNIFKLKTSGEIIREKREKKGLLLRHVSAQLDIDTAILSKIERGERKATKEQITKLADILDLDKESLLIQYLSERILYEVQDEDLALQAMHVAEQKIKYKKKNDKH
jgi:transcriptional regulator with XRE-family HTH domain